MDVAQEIQKLQELRQIGALSEAEFTRAKQTVLAGGLGSPPAATGPSILGSMLRSGRFWVFLILLGVGIAAYFTNPSRAKLEQSHGQAGTKLQGAAVTCETTNLYLFSIGKVKVERTGLGTDLQSTAFGCFGHWWTFGDSIKEAERRQKIADDALARVQGNGQQILNSAYPVFVTYQSAKMDGIARIDDGYQATVKMDYSTILGANYFLEILVKYDSSGGYRSWSLGNYNGKLPPNLHGKFIELVIRTGL